MTRTRLGRLRPLISAVVAAATFAATFTPYFATPAEAAAVSNYNLKIAVTYQGGSRPDSAVGEARPPLPAEPSDPNLTPPITPETEFVFEVLCTNSSVCNGADAPNRITWDFGDGHRKTAGTTVTHVYESPGVYTVRATAAQGTHYGETLRKVYVSPRWADIITVRGYDEVIRNDSPLLYWRLGETPGSSVVVDSSEQGNTATLGGSPELGVAGAIASGTNTAVRLQNGDTISATNPIGGIMGNAPLTVEAWIRLEGSSADQEVLRLGSVSDDGSLVISRTLADQIRVQVEGGGAVQAALLAGWNHIMVTWTPGVSGVLPGQLYVNGNQAGSIATGTLDLDGSFTIGGGFTGSVDEVAVYDRSLGAARAVARYQAGAEERISEARSDREAMWVAGALGLVDSCRTATRDDGADGVEVGRAMFCPEPRPSSALVTHLEANGPILIPKTDGRAVNGVTGEDCLAWWGACGLDKQYFASSIPATTSPEDVDVAGLEAARKLDGDGSLIYDPRNCGDGWTMERSPSGAFELKPGVEDGCTSRAEWYEMLVRAVDGHLTRSPALRSGRWAEDPVICAEPAAQSFSYRRAAALGLTGVSGSENPVGEPCGLDAAITKGEAMASLARALGVDPQAGCSQTLRDLYDPSLGEWLEFQRVADPDCGLIDGGVLRGIPLVGDLNCHWEPAGGWAPESVGTCINPHDSLNRASSAALIAGVITEEGRGAGALTLDLTQDGPKPVGTILTVVATGRAPLTTFGDFTFTFPNPPNANRLCSGTMVVPTHEYSGERRAVASCGYSFDAEVEVPLEVSIRDVYGNEDSEMILISATNEAPDAPTPSTVGEFSEAPNASASTIFTSYDINGQAVAFEVARNELNPYSGVNGPEGAYQVAVASDSPIAYWRLAEANGPVQDSAGSYHGSVVGDLNRSQSGALAEGNNPAYAFNGTGHVAVPNLPSAGAGKTTVELWMYWNGGSDQVIAAFEDGQWLAIFDGFIGFVDGLEEETTGDGLFYAARTIGLSGQWTHVVAEFAPDMADNKLYLNGVEQNLEPLKNPVWVGDTSVGVGGPGLTLGAAPDGSHGFGGRLDEVAVYHGELNPTRRRIHQELGRRQVIAADENGRDMVRLEVEQLTANTARVIVRALTGDVNGNYSFLIRATDGDKASEPTLVEGTIDPVNDAPVVASGVISNTAIEGGPDVYGSLYGADPGDAGWAGPATSIVTYRITSGPAAGVLYYDSDSGPGTTWTEYNGGTVDTNNPVLRYTPDGGPYGDGYWGVTYQVLDTGYPNPGAWSAARTAYFYVINSNDPPVCLDVIAATDEDEPKTIWFNCADPEDDELEYEVITAPGHGTLTGDGASRTYTPDLNWCGEDSYTYRAFDGELYSGVQTVYVEVTCVNDAPTTPSPSMMLPVNEDTSAVQTFTTTDVDGGPEWTFEVSADGETWSTTTQVTTSGGDSNGAVTITVNQGALDDKEASVTVSPAANICGDYVFYIRAYDGADHSEPGEVSGTINCINDAPTTPSPSTMPTVNEDNSAVQTFTTTDSDGGPQWTFEVSNSSGSGFTTTSKAITGGTVSINQGSLTDKSASITFTPNANWCGNYTFYVRVFDGVDYSPVRTVTGTITCINDAPTTPTINSSWGTQYEDGGNIAVTHGSGATRAWERTYTTTDVDVNGTGTGSNRWCMQVRAWDGSWQPSNVSNCPSNTNTSNWVETAITRSGSTNYVWGLVQQGSLTDKTAKLRIIPRPNFDGNVSVSVRFCDDGGACSGAHTQTLSIKPYKDHVILVDYASGNFRWRESNPIGAGLSNSNQWATANLNGTHRSQPVVGDWNGDGRDDRAVLHKSNNDITGTWVFNSEFGTSLPAYWEVPVPSSSSSDQNGRRGSQVRAFAGDWDGDGDDDYALWSNLAGRVWLLDNDTKAGTCWGHSTQPQSTHWRGGCSNAASDRFVMLQGQAVASGDVNGDGRDEVFLFDVYDGNGNAGMWQVRSSSNGAYVVPPFSFGPQCDYKSSTAAERNWMEHCFAVVGDWDGNGTETVGVFLRAPFGSHPRNRFFWSNNYSGTLAGQHDFPNGSQQSTYMGVFGYDKP